MLLPDPSGWLQLAPGVYRHHCRGLSSGTGSEVAWNTAEPGTSLSRGTPGKSFGSGCRSATVTYPVACTNRSNSAFVTGVRSIQNPSTETRCVGSASGMPQSSPPIQNVPPAIHTILEVGAVAGAVPAAGGITRGSTSRDDEKNGSKRDQGWPHAGAA